VARAGEALVLHKDAEKMERWDMLKETNPILRSLVGLRKAYDESEHPVVSTLRGVTDSVGSFLFDETEQAQVMKLLKQMDPTFNQETFQRELREYIIPEVVDAYLSADKEALKLWCGEAVCGPGIQRVAVVSDGDVDLQCTLGDTGDVFETGSYQRQQSA
jgi:import inner membrane translocase subunit TIM44